MALWRLLLSGYVEIVLHLLSKYTYCVRILSPTYRAWETPANLNHWSIQSGLTRGDIFHYPLKLSHSWLGCLDWASERVTSGKYQKLSTLWLGVTSRLTLFSNQLMIAQYTLAALRGWTARWTGLRWVRLWAVCLYQAGQAARSKVSKRFMQPAGWQVFEKLTNHLSYYYRGRASSDSLVLL